MTRAIWNGAISFGLVTVPVALHAATESKEELSFDLLHAKDGSRIAYKRFCKEEDVEVPWSEIVKGYEYEKGQHVVLTEKDFAKARVPATQTFEIRAFVPGQEIADLYFDHPYYVAPTGKVAMKAYALLRDALGETGRVGIGTIVMRQREHLAALEPAGDALVLTTMRFAHEIRSPKDLDPPGAAHGYTKKEMQLARSLIDTLAADWDPREYQDTYTDVLRQVIQRKVEGKTVPAPAAPRAAKVISLTKALEASLRSPRKGLEKAGARRPARARRARTRSAA